MKLDKVFIFLALIVTLVVAIALIKSEYFDNINSTALTLISGGLGFIISKIIEDLKESKQRIYSQKREYYNSLIKPYRTILKGLRESESTELSREQIADAMDSAFDNILYASDDVIKKYGIFRNNNINDTKDGSINTFKILKLFSQLLLAMRQDLGNKYTSLDEVHILRMFINIPDSDEELYREEFRKIK